MSNALYLYTEWIFKIHIHAQRHRARIICETFICWDFIGFLWFRFDQMTILGLCDRFKKKILSQSRTHSLYGLCYRHSRISLFISCWPVYSLNSYSMTDWFAIRRQMYEWKGILCDRSLIRILTTFLCVFILNADLFWPPHGTLFLSSWWCRFVDFMRFDHPHY